jgi:hypothetical protein
LQKIIFFLDFLRKHEFANQRFLTFPQMFRKVDAIFACDTRFSSFDDRRPEGPRCQLFGSASIAPTHERNAMFQS